MTQFTDEDYERLVATAPEPLVGTIRQMLGCGWGTVVWTEEDSELCEKRAVGIVVMYQDDMEVEGRLCEHHREVILEASVPHKEGP